MLESNAYEARPRVTHPSKGPARQLLLALMLALLVVVVVPVLLLVELVMLLEMLRIICIVAARQPGYASSQSSLTLSAIRCMHAIQRYRQPC